MGEYYWQRCYRPIEIKMVKIEVTQKCNSRCKTCATWQIQDTTLSKNQELRSSLQLADFLRIIEQLKQFGCKFVELHGGEPTLFVELPKIVEHCSSLGIMTIVTTNGLSMSPEMAQGLIDGGVTRINYSVDGPEECHNYLRGREDAFAKMLEAMRMIREADQGNRVIKNINTMVSTGNIHRIEEVIQIASENKLDMVTFVHPSIIKAQVVEETNQIFGEIVASHRTVCSSDFLITDGALIEEKREAIKREARKYRVKFDKTNFFTLPIEEISSGIKRHPKPCWDIYGCLLIDANGNLAPCELLRFNLGNLQENSLVEIFQNGRFEKFTEIYCKNIENLNLCQYCVDAVY